VPLSELQQITVGVDELNMERAEVTSGSIFANLVAMFIIIATGATLYLHGEHNISTASQAARALEPFAGHYAEVLFKASKVREAIAQWETSLREWQSSSPAELDSAEVSKVKDKLENARVQLARQSNGRQ